MKKIIFILTLIMGSLCVANPSFFTSQRMLSGDLNSQQNEHPCVSLNNEVLNINMNNGVFYDIAYKFKNHCNKKQIVNTAFPIKTSFSIYKTSKNTFSVVHQFDDHFSYFFYYILKLKNKQVKVFDESGEISDTFAFSIKNIKTPKALAFSKYLSYKAFKKHFYNKKLPNSLQKSDLINSNMFKNYKFYQNGKRLKINGVYLTFKIYKVRRGKYYVNKAVFTVNFLHKMVFKPKQSSDVKVKYKAHSYTACEGNSTHINKNTYILGTGRTWRGNIKSVQIITPYFLTPSLPKAFKKIRGGNPKYNYYLAKNYEPKKTDIIFIHTEYERTTLYNCTGTHKSFKFSESDFEKFQ